MFDPASLLEMHSRTHSGVSALLEHCRALSPEELRREHAASGYPTVQLVLHHIIRILARLHPTGSRTGKHYRVVAGQPAAITTLLRWCTAS